METFHNFLTVIAANKMGIAILVFLLVVAVVQTISVVKYISKKVKN